MAKEEQVPLSALMKAKEEIANLKSELKLAKANLEDSEEVKDVRAFLLERDKELNEREVTLTRRQEELETRQTSLNERDKESRIQSLVSEYAPKGEDEEIKKAQKVFLEAIKDADDPEKEALKLFAERLSKEKEATPAEKAFDRTPAGGQIKKKIIDMTEDEFKTKEQELKAEYQKKAA